MFATYDSVYMCFDMCMAQFSLGGVLPTPLFAYIQWSAMGGGQGKLFQKFDQTHHKLDT